MRYPCGCVIHSSRGVSFAGWIGDVAVFDRALCEKGLGELVKLR